MFVKERILQPIERRVGSQSITQKTVMKALRADSLKLM